MAEVRSPGSFQDFINGNTGVEDRSVLLDSYTDELVAYQESLASAHGVSVEELRLGHFAVDQATDEASAS